MSKYQNALDNLANIIKILGANKYKKDIKVLQELIDHYQIIQSDARKRAIEILKDTMLYGEVYYTMEDWLTECLCGNITELPFEMEHEYLRCAIRIEIKDYFECVNAQYTDEEVEEVLNRLFGHFSESVLNQTFINDTVHRYLCERNTLSMEDLNV